MRPDLSPPPSYLGVGAGMCTCYALSQSLMRCRFARGVESIGYPLVEIAHTELHFRCRSESTHAIHHPPHQQSCASVDASTHLEEHRARRVSCFISVSLLSLLPHMIHG